MDYARFIAASLFYLAIHNQRDAAGLIVFDEQVRDIVRPPRGRASLLASSLPSNAPSPTRAPILQSPSIIFRNFSTAVASLL